MSTAAESAKTAELLEENKQLRSTIADYEATLGALTRTVVGQLGQDALEKALRKAAREYPQPDKRKEDVMLTVAKEHLRLVQEHLTQSTPACGLRLRDIAKRATELHVLTLVPGEETT